MGIVRQTMSFLSAASPPDSADLEEEMLEELVDAETAADPAVGLVGTLSTYSWSALSWSARTLRSSYGWATGSAEQNKLSEAALDDPESADEILPGCDTASIPISLLVAGASDPEPLTLDPAIVRDNIVLMNATRLPVTVDVYNRDDIARVIARRCHTILPSEPCVSPGD